MRILLALLALPLFVVSAHAQTAATSTTTKPANAHHTMDQRFQQANVTHDGHLTADQAKTGYKSIARHFAAIDLDKKGYITEADIRAFDKTQRTLHQQAAATKHTSTN